ncbi:hypothetical protein [Planctopirus limnophila]|uniref:hypothetical protein n=1 Tax=Planctopirus limnophila TaxID=120 RepID=UPI0001A30B72|nr:hypothetical protein [Planctopirus limnophila]
MVRAILTTFLLSAALLLSALLIDVARNRGMTRNSETYRLQSALRSTVQEFVESLRSRIQQKD